MSLKTNVFLSALLLQFFIQTSFQHIPESDEKPVKISDLVHSDDQSSDYPIDSVTEGILDPCDDAVLHLQDIALTKSDLPKIFGPNATKIFEQIVSKEQAPEGYLVSRRVKRSEIDSVQEPVHKFPYNTQSRTKRAVTADPARIWPYGIIPYDISSNFTGDQRQIFKQAMRHWELHTCVTFIEKTDQSDYVLFTSRPCGCCSFVGKKGNGPQAISIGKNCDKLGIVIHELGHVIGFWHEHTRPDRDQYIDIQWLNIQPGQEYNFGKMDNTEINSLGFAYDYDSIMHYSRNTFSSQVLVDTIVPKIDVDTGIKPAIGQRIKLSTGDIDQARALYACPACGATFQESEGVIQSPKWPARLGSQDGETRCTWRISVTPGEKIELRFNSLEMFGVNNQCVYDFVELRDGHYEGSPLLGRYCNKDENLPKSITSTGARMWIHFKYTSRVPKVGFEMQYMAKCGGTFKNEGELKSPNYPDTYTSRKDCEWVMEVEENKKVALKFDSFEVEGDDACNYDYLEVRDGPNSDSELIKRYCGSEIPKTIVSTSNKLYAKFHSDNSVNKAGFSAKFFPEWDECENMHLLDDSDPNKCQQKCVNTDEGFECKCEAGWKLNEDGRSCEEACGGYLTAESGVIKSPGYPDNYFWGL